ncbi:MAG: hypothetical protein HYZ19_01885 [Rhodocyclales bacterium]|nr:hypothetical protein [Rhodocyclales bacterium]
MGEALPLVLSGLALASLGVALAVFAHGLHARRQAYRYKIFTNPGKPGLPSQPQPSEQACRSIQE